MACKCMLSLPQDMGASVILEALHCSRFVQRAHILEPGPHAVLALIVIKADLIEHLPQVD